MGVTGGLNVSLPPHYNVLSEWHQKHQTLRGGDRTEIDISKLQVSTQTLFHFNTYLEIQN